MQNTEYLNLQEAAELLKVSPQTVYQYVHKKKIPSYKPFGKKLYFRKDELLNICGNGKQPTAEEIETQAATYLMNKGAR